MGFKVQIHDQREPPLITELGFGVSPGFQTLVTAKEQRVSRKKTNRMKISHTPGLSPDMTVNTV